MKLTKLLSGEVVMVKTTMVCDHLISKADHLNQSTCTGAVSPYRRYR